MSSLIQVLSDSAECAMCAVCYHYHKLFPATNESYALEAIFIIKRYFEALNINGVMHVIFSRIIN
jgi:hypothetical protein